MQYLTSLDSYIHLFWGCAVLNDVWKLRENQSYRDGIWPPVGAAWNSQDVLETFLGWVLVWFCTQTLWPDPLRNKTCLKEVSYLLEWETLCTELCDCSQEFTSRCTKSPLRWKSLEVGIQRELEVKIKSRKKSASYSPQDKSSPLPVLENKVLLEHRHAHRVTQSLLSFQWQCWLSATGDYVSHKAKNIYHLSSYSNYSPACGEDFQAMPPYKDH